MAKGTFKSDAESVKKFIADKIAAKGYYAFLMKTAKNATDKHKNLALQLGLVRLTDPDDSTSQQGKSLNLWVTLPLDNDEVEGHTAPSYGMRNAAELLGACYPDEVPGWLVWDGDNKVWYFEGETIPADDKAAVNAARRKASIAAGTKSEEINENPQELVGSIVWGEVVHGSWNGEPSPEVKGIAAPNSRDWVLNTDPDTFDVYPDETPDAEGNGAADPSKKRARSTAGARATGGRKTKKKASGRATRRR